MEKEERMKTYNEFKEGKHRVLISTNVTARGLDVQQVSTVINFDMTRSYETYLHAIGRSGRFGRKGLAINFVTKHDIDFMRRLEKHYNITISELPADVEKLI